MASSVKYVMSFKDRYDRTVGVFISTADYAGSIITLSAGADPLHISYKGDEGDMFQTMISSQAVISINLEEANDELFEDISTMNEDTFGLLITVRNPDLSIAYKWEGFIIPDEQVRNFSYFNQEINLTAIDPIGRLKGLKLLNTNGSYIYGKQSMQYIVDRCFAAVYASSNAFGSVNLLIYSDLVISNTTTTTLPGIFRQLMINSEAFNDDVGRPVSCFDVIERIAMSLFMRVFYENGNIYFIDIINYAGLSPTPVIELNYLYYKDFDSFVVEGDTTILISNNENITRTRTFRDSIVKFTYTNAVGLLFDGHLVNWSVSGSGFKLAQWYYNPYLTFRPDVDLRRIGTGRPENPYGMLLKYTSSYVSGDDYQFRMFDVICSKTSERVYAGQEFSLDVTVKLVHPELIPFINTSDGWKQVATLPIWIVAFNALDPSKSYFYQNDAWNEKTLSGSEFETSGSPDWITFFGEYDAILNPGSPSPYNGLPLGALKYNISYTLEPTSNEQVVNIDLSALPGPFIGDIYFFVHPAVGTQTDTANDSADTLLYSAILTSKIEKVNNGKYTGEIEYLSREIRTSQDNITREIAFNTTINSTIAGSLSNAVSYVEGSTTIPVKTNLLKISLKDYFEPLFTGVPLIEYNAIGQMWLNYPQYKVDFETMGKDNFFWKGLLFAAWVDPSKPSTDIYNSAFMQNTSDYNVKECSRKISATSTKSVIRTITTNTLDETHDFSEYYYLK